MPVDQRLDAVGAQVHRAARTLTPQAHLLVARHQHARGQLTILAAFRRQGDVGLALGRRELHALGAEELGRARGTGLFFGGPHEIPGLAPLELGQLALEVGHLGAVFVGQLGAISIAVRRGLLASQLGGPLLAVLVEIGQVLLVICLVVVEVFLPVRVLALQLRLVLGSLPLVLAHVGGGLGLHRGSLRGQHFVHEIAQAERQVLLARQGLAHVQVEEAAQVGAHHALLPGLFQVGAVDLDPQRAAEPLGEADPGTLGAGHDAAVLDHQICVQACAVGHLQLSQAEAVAARLQRCAGVDRGVFDHGGGGLGLLGHLLGVARGRHLLVLLLLLVEQLRAALHHAGRLDVVGLEGLGFAVGPHGHAYAPSAQVAGHLDLAVVADELCLALEPTCLQRAQAHLVVELHLRGGHLQRCVVSLVHVALAIAERHGARERQVGEASRVAARGLVVDLPLGAREADVFEHVERVPDLGSEPGKQRR